MRIESDLLGEKEIPAVAYYGIHTQRALDNFSIAGYPIHRQLVHSLVQVKKAAALTNMEIGILSQTIGEAIIGACDEILSGKLLEHFVVDALQGGAGTSANMNANEVIANRAIELLGKSKGDYQFVHPLDHVNLSQSTNDVFPTALRIAAIKMVITLSERFAELQSTLQEKESQFARVIKVGRTQLQDALPVTLGQEFGAYAQAIARDRWRLYKAEERLRQVNLGGTAVGTGMNAERKYVMLVIEKLRTITGIGLARAEYMMDPTQNSDVFVEVSGFIKASAVNLSKISGDLRLMASGPHAGFGEINLPPMQAGSSMMPGKVNPVICEAVGQIAFKAMGDDMTIAIAAQSGQLELNPFLPLVAHSLLGMLGEMTRGVEMFTHRCIKGISANEERCSNLLEKSLVFATALAPVIGYDKASLVARECLKQGLTVREFILKEGIMDEALVTRLLNPLGLTKPGMRRT